jgi:hypothetical protein
MLYKFPSIGQFRNAIKAITDKAQWDGRDENGDPKFNRGVDLPKLKFRGTVKLHGTNAAVVRNEDTKEFTFQSRERELTITSDNAGFALFMESKKKTLSTMVDEIVTLTCESDNTPPIKHVAIFGEWCGGNIQSSVAINGLPKMFVVFAVKLCFGNDAGDETTSRWVDLKVIKDLEFPDDNIYNVLRFGEWNVEIDFSNPLLSQNEIIDMTIEVEKQCPAGKHFAIANYHNAIVKLENGKVISDTTLPEELKSKVRDILIQLVANGVDEPALTLSVD